MIIHSHIFEGIDKNTVKEILCEVSIENFEEDTTIFHKGDVSNGKCYIIGQGEVSITIEKKHITTLGEGEIFGEIALLNEEKRSATAHTISAVKLLVISKQSLIKLVVENPKIGKLVMKRLEENIVHKY